jgi:V-type H+-transporting ATPase subunit H
MNNDGLLNGQLINKLVAIVQSRFSSKVSRVILGYFENMLGRENFNEMLVMFSFHPTLESLNEEKSEDQEFQNSVKNLLEKLVVSVKIMTSMERYEKELESSKLTWGPCHSEVFWKRYAAQFDLDNYKHIKRLIKLLQSQDTETVAVACNDLGEWSRFYPDGKKVIETLKGKSILMQLIGHKDPTVSKHAIVAVQKMLIKNWKALDAQKTEDSKDQS